MKRSDIILFDVAYDLFRGRITSRDWQDSVRGATDHPLPLGAAVSAISLRGTPCGRYR